LSIPVTAVALRAALLPLTIKAKGAAVNFALMRHAAETAGAALRREEEEEEGKEGRRRQDKPNPTPNSSTRFALARRYYGLLRRQHGTSSMWWYHLNVLAQVNVFVSMSAALRQMAGAAWPGLASEGALWFPDLTVPSVVVGGGWVTPLGVAGLFLPLGVLAAYMATVDRAAPAASSRAARATLELAALPVFLAALVVPQATLLYWLPSSAFQLLTQRALDGNPRLAARLGVPLVAIQAAGGGSGGGAAAATATQDQIRRLAAEHGRALVEGCKEGEEDAEFLRFLAADRLARGDVPAALRALERLTTAVAPRDAEAWRGRGALAARLGRWAEAARAFEVGAEIIDESGGGGVSAVESKRRPGLRRALLVRAGTAHLNAISAEVAAATTSPDDQQQNSPPPLSPEQRRHLDAALAALNRATSLPQAEIGGAPALDAFDAWQALGTARVLARQWRPAGDAAQRAWQALSAATADPPPSSPPAAAIQQRARQLLPLLRRVVGHLTGEADDSGTPQRLASAARAAAGAAELAGDKEGAGEAARLLAADLKRAIEVVRGRDGGRGAAAASALEVVERVAEAMTTVAGR
jgi:tetratricopeptide (TPR) repeat protein